MLSPMERADLLYQCARKSECRDHPVEHEQLRRFWTASHDLKGTLGDAFNVASWRPFLQWLRRFRGGCAFTPLPFDHPSFGSLAALDELHRFRTLADEFLPGASARVTELLDLARRVILSKDNPLFRVLETFQGPNTAVMIGDGRFIEDVQNELASAQVEMSVVSPNHLRSDEHYDHLVILAPSSQIPDYVLAAPRAPLITVLRYAWLPAPSPARSVFRRDDSPQSAAPRQISVFEHFQDSFAPSMRRALEQARTAAEADDMSDVSAVQATVVLLDGGEAVCLDLESRALVIDTVASQRQGIWQYRVRDLQPGMFLLLRSGGGGDYIAPLADAILRERAGEARQAQRHWKQLLRERIRRHGIHNVVVSLAGLGAPRAADYNVRNWASESNIRTQDRQDFDAIMQYIGLADQTECYWNLMGEIDRAHRKAGHQLRKELLRKVRESDLSQLYRRGRMNFALNSEGAVSMTAYRIVHVAPDVVTVSSGRLGRPFVVEEEMPWLE